MAFGKRIYFCITILLFSFGIARAQELYGPEIGVIPYGMGRAYSAVAEDWLSLYYNPAGLALVKNIDIQMYDLKLEGSQDVVTSISKLKTLTGSSTSTAAKINALMGKHISGKASNVSQITMPHFAAGFVYDIHLDADMENRSYPVTNLRYTKDLSLLSGLAGSLGRKKEFRVGATIKYMHRTGGFEMIDISQIAILKGSLLSTLSNSGSGIGSDIGAQWTFFSNGRTEASAAWVWHDIGKTSFGDFQSKNRPTRVDDDMVAGLALRFPIGGTVNRRIVRRYGQPRSTHALTLAMDYSHLNLSTDKEQLAKHLHFGANLDLPIFSLQMGVNQSSFTLGTSFNAGVLRVSLATYGEELGSYAGQKRDRRYMLSVGSSFGGGKF